MTQPQLHARTALVRPLYVPDERPNLIVVCGPNASGKTRLGVSLARHVHGEILSVDSRQVYRGLDIGTGKDLSEYGEGTSRVRCHLIDIAEPRHVYTLWHYQRDFYRAFGDIRSRGIVPVAVGGTGLYLEAVLKQYKVPNVPESPPLRARLMHHSIDELLRRLRELDGELYERTDRSSKKRVVRSIEVALYAQKHEVSWGHPDPPRIVPFVIGVRWERDQLRERIRDRLQQRLEAGLVGEVRRLREQGISWERLDLMGLEYRYVGAHLQGETDRADMREALYHAICRFAKRQLTYFRGMERRGTPIHWVDNADEDGARELIDRLGTTS